MNKQEETQLQLFHDAPEATTETAASPSQCGVVGDIEESVDHPLSARAELGALFRDRLGVLTSDEFAAMFMLRLSTPEAWRSRGEGPKYFKAGKKVFYLFDDVRDWLNERRKSPGATE